MRSPLFTAIVVLSLSLGLAAEAARPKRPSESEVECALRVLRAAAKSAKPDELDRLRNEIVNGTELIPADRPALEPVQLMLIKALSTDTQNGFTDTEITDRMQAMGFMDKANGKRSADQIHTMLFSMSSRNESKGLYVRADWERASVRFYPTAFALKELENAKWFVGRVRDIADRTRRHTIPRVTTMHGWMQTLKDSAIGKFDLPKIGNATAVVMAHLHPELTEYVTNLSGDAVYGDGLGTPTTTGHVYQILRDLHSTGLAEREYVSGNRLSWRPCPKGYVGTDTSSEIDKLQVWSTLEGERVLAQWFRFHYSVLDAKAPQN
ncbi:MAG: hypothetical protein H6617_03035 [Bdellovibrionaceae bacterium]|nr:hypothetical protein [Bdellovibrionales bacterium]MCB9253634.1 hypothetical protein [Pseudobdellovibrionaceae bacterium]